MLLIQREGLDHVLDALVRNHSPDSDDRRLAIRLCSYAAMALDVQQEWHHGSLAQPCVAKVGGIKGRIRNQCGWPRKACERLAAAIAQLGDLWVELSEVLARGDVVVAERDPFRRTQGEFSCGTPDRISEDHASLAQQSLAGAVEPVHAPQEGWVDMLSHDLARMAPSGEKLLPCERLIRDRVVGRRGREQLVNDGHAAIFSIVVCNRLLTAGQLYSPRT